jgi:hypothetical protein
MRTVILQPERLLQLLKNQKIAMMQELKNALGTNSCVTIFRKLKELDYISSCSHSGKYYSLKRIARFNSKGLWVFKSVLFSIHGTLAETIKAFIEHSEQGYSSIELEKLFQVKPNGPLLELVKNKVICREKMFGSYVYFSKDSMVRKRQELFRIDSVKRFNLEKMEPEVLMNELKAAIIIFFSLLNEKQRRLYAGLESMKAGRGGDRIISDLLGINVKTVTKGRKELLADKINIDTIRQTGGGRKT